MSEAVVVAVITGVLSLVGVVITNRQHGIEIDHKLDKAQAVTETKLDALTREVREHNNFAKRIPVIEEQIRSYGARLDSLERHGE